MKKIHYSLLMFVMGFITFSAVSHQSNSMTISAEMARPEKMPLLLGILGTSEGHLLPMAQLLKTMLDRNKVKTLGFAVHVQTFAKKPMIKTISKEFPLALFINMSRDQKSIEWRLYDTQYAKMVQGKRFAIEGYSIRLQAEHLADEVWPLLTGQEGFFSTRIAICKEVKAPNLRGFKQICLIAPYADPLASEYVLLQEVIVNNGRIFAPRWNSDIKNPVLLYSESTRSNVRLMSVDFQKRRKIVSNFEGLNILPSFSSDGNNVVYCIAQGGKSQLYLYTYDSKEQKPFLKQLTNNEGNNISPILSSNGDIIFCSDFKTKGPQICYYHASDGTIDTLTNGGYCACPTLCEKNNLIAYCKLVDGVMQMFVYDMNSKYHEQITFDATNKEECTWSPCGNFLAYSVDDGRTSRIAVFNRMTKEQTYITSSNDRCIYPSWSPQYKVPCMIS
jgi:TolB protein